jgi:hypothetical protein
MAGKKYKWGGPFPGKWSSPFNRLIKRIYLLAAVSLAAFRARSYQTRFFPILQRFVKIFTQIFVKIFTQIFVKIFIQIFVKIFKQIFVKIFQQIFVKIFIQLCVKFHSNMCKITFKYVKHESYQIFTNICKLN